MAGERKSKYAEEFNILIIGLYIKERYAET